jgi:succinate dehydrogenase flavin-adding protein (antitoxin of CptAB toxin-antitoxin module)
MTVPYDEIEFIEFTDLMNSKDATLYRVALKEYVPNSRQSKAWAL